MHPSRTRSLFAVLASAVASRLELDPGKESGKHGVIRQLRSTEVLSCIFTESGVNA